MCFRVHDRSEVLSFLRCATGPGANASDRGLGHPRPGPVCGSKNMAKVRNGANLIVLSWRTIPFPGWLRYLHFHEIKNGVGLPTTSLIAFIVGIGCLAGAVGVSFFYRASNLAEFQAIQMWRIQWLLAATASFVAGILLKRPSDSDGD